MTYLIFSDIHGTLNSCEFIIKKYNELQPNKLILLGDILYHGPRNDLPDTYNPKAVIKLLNPIADKIICVKGNCDAEVDQMVLNFKIWTNKIIKFHNKKILLTHGHHINHLEPIKNNNINIVIHGHTHVNRIDVINNCTYINLGSISIPKDNIKSYAIMNDNGIYIYDINDILILKYDF